MFTDPKTPNLADFTVFVYNQGVPTSSLPSNSPYLEWAFNQAVATVLCCPPLLNSTVYVLAVYNFGMNYLVYIAQDINQQVNAAIDPPNIGTQALVTPVVNSNGNIDKFIIDNPGSGYISTPLMVIDPPDSGVTATATVIVMGGMVTGFNITNPGLGYTVSNFWGALRAKYQILDFVSGVITESHDKDTGNTPVVPEFYKNITLSTLDDMKTPWGRAYSKYAQAFGPNLVVVA